MDLFSEKSRRTYWRIGTFLAPILAILALLVFFRISPFGDTPRRLAGDNGYLAYLSGLRRFLSGNGFFGFADLASDASSLHARYLGSPFTLLNALAPASLHETAFFILLTVKSGLAALFFSFYLNRRNPSLSPAFSLILSSFYALSSILALHDGLALLPEQLMLLPLLLLAFDAFFANGKIFPLTLCLAFAFLTGYAFAYATLLFALLALLLSFIGGHTTNTNGLSLGGTFLSLALSFLLAALIALPILLPALSNTDKIGLLGAYSGAPLYRFPFLLLGFWPGVYMPEFPVFYIGILPLLVLPLFFSCHSLSKRYRLTTAIMIFSLLLLFFFVNPFGGALSFGLSLITILPCADFLVQREKINRTPLAITVVSLLIIPTLLQKCAFSVPSGEGSIPILSSMFGVYIPLVLLAVTALALAGVFDRENNRALIALLILLTLTDGAASTFSRVTGKNFLASEDHNTVSSIPANILTSVNQNQDKPYRLRLYVDQNHRIPYGHGFLLGNGDAALLSPDIQALLTSLGYNMTVGHDSEPLYLPDALLGVSRILSNKISTSVINRRDYEVLQEEDDYLLIGTTALPLVFTASKDVLSLDAEPSSPFVYTNALLSAIRGEALEIYKPSATVKKEADGQISYEGTAENTGYAYFYYKPHEYKSYRLTIAGKAYTLFEGGIDRGVLPLGYYYAGRGLDITFEDGQAITTPSEAAFIWIEDSELLLNAISEISKGALQNAILDGNTLTGQVTAKEGEVLMTTLAYDAGYTVKLDGKEVERQSVHGLLALSLPSGTHTVTIIRTSSLGLALPTLIVSLVGIFLLVLFSFSKIKLKTGKSK